jgi:hypothetical protein
VNYTYLIGECQDILAMAVSIRRFEEHRNEWWFIFGVTVYHMPFMILDVKQNVLCIVIHFLIDNVIVEWHEETLVA